jgi:hypothetical protein
MPGYLTDLEIWKALWPLFFFALASAFAICRIFTAKAYRGTLPPVFALCLLGIVTGQVTGLSRDAAVGTVIPAILGLLGGIVLYLIGSKGKELQGLVVMGVVGLSLNLVVGIYWGAYSRDAYEAYASRPEVLTAQALAEEKARYTAALQRLVDEHKYAELKAKLEASSPKQAARESGKAP